MLEVFDRDSRHDLPLESTTIVVFLPLETRGAVLVSTPLRVELGSSLQQTQGGRSAISLLFSVGLLLYHDK